MRIPRKPTARASNLDVRVAAVRREAEGAEADPFDEAMIAAVAGLADAMKEQADALAEIVAEQCKVARRVAR